MNRIDRRRFLVGSGGAVLALPMLEAFMPRAAFAQAMPPPKRLVIFHHPHGRSVGNGNGSDRWSPRATTGALPEDLGLMLGPLAAVKSSIVTLDGVDNLVRHTSHDGDGHRSASYTSLTCMKPSLAANGEANGATGPSFDYFAGLRLRASAGQRTAIVLPASDNGGFYEGGCFYGNNGTAASVTPLSPVATITDIFGKAVTAGPPPPPTLRERLQQRRPTILDAVAKSFTTLRSQVNAADKARLDQHAEFIQSVSTRFTSTGGGMASSSCTRPAESSIQTFPKNSYAQGAHDDITAAAQIENLVQALACDITRVASLRFWMNYDPSFAPAFPGGSPFIAQNYHDAIHNSPNVATGQFVTNLQTAYRFYASMFTKLVQRLAQMKDTNGEPMLDSTLVIWTSDMGYGSSHYDFNIPVVLAGMKSAFPQGQGRHVASGQRHSLGDLFAHALRMLGGTDTTFGATGTIGAVYGSGPTDNNCFAWAGYPGFIHPSTPLHFGALDL